LSAGFEPASLAPVRREDSTVGNLSQSALSEKYVADKVTPVDVV
jgi:hypothetical protein